MITIPNLNRNSAEQNAESVANVPKENKCVSAKFFLLRWTGTVCWGLKGRCVKQAVILRSMFCPGQGPDDPTLRVPTSVVMSLSGGSQLRNVGMCCTS